MCFLMYEIYKLILSGEDLIIVSGLDFSRALGQSVSSTGPRISRMCSNIFRLRLRLGHSKLDFSFPSGPDFKLHRAGGPFPLAIIVSER